MAEEREGGPGADCAPRSVFFEFSPLRERTLLGTVAAAVLSFVASFAPTPAVAVASEWLALSTACVCGFLLFVGNIHAQDLLSGIKSFPFLTSLVACLMSVAAEAAAGRNVAAGMVLVLTIPIPMLHLACIVVYRRIALSVIGFALVATTALAVLATLRERDVVLFDVGGLAYTYLGVRRSSVATLWTTTAVLVVEGVLPRNGADSLPLSKVDALRWEPLIEDSLSLPAWSLSRARSALLVGRWFERNRVEDEARKGQPALPQRILDLASIHAARAESTKTRGRTQRPESRGAPMQEQRGRSRLSLAPALKERHAGVHVANASWRIVHAVYTHAKACKALLPVPAALAGSKSAAAAAVAVVGVGAFFAPAPGACGGIIASLVSLVATVVVTWLLYAGQTSSRLVARAAAQPPIWVIGVWIGILVIDNVLWATRAGTCPAIRGSINTAAVIGFMCLFLFAPARRRGSPRLEAFLAGVTLTTQLFQAATWSLWPMQVAYSFRLPGGAVIDEQDVLRNCYVQLSLALARVVSTMMLRDRKGANRHGCLSKRCRLCRLCGAEDAKVSPSPARSPAPGLMAPAPRQASEAQPSSMPSSNSPLDQDKDGCYLDGANQGLKLLAPRRNRVDAYVSELALDIASSSFDRTSVANVSAEDWDLVEHWLGTAMVDCA